ncbi:MAG: TOMM precursor leader peptide-binding protein, partial [Deinococcus-Thermus bacterium]|nr:TOMM precursor leader peptide-binding protein [Deinococcota bacterium]
MDRPRFRAHWRVDRPTPTDIALTGEVGYHLVGGRALAAMAPHLDGTAETGALLDRLKDAVSPPEFFYALMTGEKAGYLADAAHDGDCPRAEVAFWDLLGAAATTGDILAGFPIGVAALGGAEAGPVRDALVADGLTVLDDPAAAAVTVAVVDDLLDPGLAETNAAALASGRPWMIVRPTGLRPAVGPIVVPGRSACWACLDFWLRGNREVADHVERTTGTPAAALAPAIAAPGTAALVGATAALELARFAARAEGALV